MKLLSSLLIAFSVFAAPVAFANDHKGDMAAAKKDAHTCNCTEGKCDGSCKEKAGHTCTGGDSCKDSSHKEHKDAAHGKKEKKG